MESLRWRRFLLHMPLMPVALVLLGGGVTTEVTGFGYLESLTPSSLPSAVTAEKESAILLSTKTTTTTCNYLDSLQLRHNNPDEGVVAAIAATTTTTSPTTEAIASASTDDWAEKTIAEIPDDHYSKFHPGAGWAGYQHPMYGGYLNNLAISSSQLGSCIERTGASDIGGRASKEIADTRRRACPTANPFDEMKGNRSAPKKLH
ncbi:hypothetical protein FRACYDRAFT_254473 [Fragilariopsis cylindrus CCMP1102]|uniref:Uncharacterized protein n=1 Tax=Fragilariopsis cylindrus CCMP1102 TaxID=635003 RepID=A0A1E7EKN1_9STRA|nr:hypothetical protein FRACYDRAFT_254473 [Fragilariopsis cylindrus CCMP1102]|eukprot:OEU06456.1 hypothetical protein FRACYDRAFT_254473 [Fragilariopsis cylindrus CCMP1102]